MDKIKTFIKVQNFIVTAGLMIGVLYAIWTNKWDLGAFLVSFLLLGQFLESNRKPIHIQELKTTIDIGDTSFIAGFILSLEKLGYKVINPKGKKNGKS